MRKVVPIFLSFFFVLTSSVKSAQNELDVDLMQAIEDTNKSLSSNIAIKDTKASTSDAKELEQMFSKVEHFFVEKGDAPDAVDLARKSKELTVEIVKSVTAQDFDTATHSATNISRNCRTCHTFYKKS